MKILFSGHHSCLNRGCEALVRTTLDHLGRTCPGASVLLPTHTPEYDARVLADAACPVQVVPREPPLLERLVHRWHRLPLPGVQRLLWPAPIPRRWRQWLRECDLVLAVGGDNYTLDYGLPSGIVGLDQCAVRMGIPVVLWGGSVGPFSARPAYERALARGLGRYRFIGARESLTLHELRHHLGLVNVHAMDDPAFMLRPESPDPFWPQALTDGAGRRVALNFSPLAPGPGAEGEVVALIRCLLEDPGTHLLLIPHVTPVRPGVEGDAALMRRLLSMAGLNEDQRRRVHEVPDTLRAAQYKGAVARCDVLMAARTHLTIAGFSLGVPTVSLGYSRKAEGLNRDLLGHAHYHVSCEHFTARVAMERLAQAQENPMPPYQPRPMPTPWNAMARP
ncbi:hypothetical protein M911_11650 [Ectothiorhodospira haloalkaliphila]|uniref:Polysaccharide pyruvyl transferase domain-containing protein n=1 Tax=Ectothiorhodospira haloalkaliphila TaxID=421628 RepID=W8KLS3_9GAMM|nr:polysaccharide pyruvyl transferase family protein [Ectothiorhodospira haloalkaliphila]AHK80729.1 hypothetical protein M911_11650 [Ectothiorhodospira haloalkaliphila]